MKSKKTLSIVLMLFLAAIPMFAAVQGDVNLDGSANIIDALLIAQYYVGMQINYDPTPGDVNCSGSIDIIDALLIAQYYVGLITSFPCAGPTNPPVQTTARTIMAFDASWLYHNGDASGADSATYSDSGWRSLSVPHDWAIEGTNPPSNPFSASNATTGRRLGGVGNRLVSQTFYPCTKPFRR